MNKLNLSGMVFGRLTAIREDGYRGKKILWLCICDCGGSVRVVANSLCSGVTKSCGCLSSELKAMRKTTHGMYGTPTYRSWSHMLSRVRDPNHHLWRRYGGRGIVVCERWLKFENFLADMGERPQGKSLDRYPNPDGNYEPGNCRWATQRQQMGNLGS